MKISHINRSTAQMLVAAMSAKIAELEAEFDVKFKAAPNWRFNASGVDVAFSAKIDVPIEETAEGRSFAAYAPRAGIDKDKLGKTFFSGNDTYRITGWASSRPKYPVSAERVSDGKGFKFTVEQIKYAAFTGV
jgi:hypothetical protein